MKKLICILLSVLMILPILPVAASADALTGLTASEIVAQMGIGWNLGNTFDATNGNTRDV